MIKIKRFVERLEMKFVERASHNSLARRYMSLEEMIRVGKVTTKITLAVGKLFGFLFLFWILNNFMTTKYGFQSAVILALVIIIFALNKD